MTQFQLLILLATDTDLGMYSCSEPSLDSCTAIVGDGTSFSRCKFVRLLSCKIDIGSLGGGGGGARRL